jgi:L-methionine (R)-S-oxide reductase
MEPDYDLLVSQAEELLARERDPIANAANFSAFVYMKLPRLNWAGFYFPAATGELVLGPFGGRPACTRLPAARGVCGAAYTSRRTVVVDDVHAFADHIVCDSASQSEIVVPLMHRGGCLGVFDVDSPMKARFSSADRDGIERLVDVFVRAIARNGVRIPTPAS